LRRLVVATPEESFWQVNGFDEPSWVIVRILVANAMAQSRGTAVVRVAKLRRNRPERSVTDIALS